MIWLFCLKRPESDYLGFLLLETKIIKFSPLEGQDRNGSKKYSAPQESEHYFVTSCSLTDLQRYALWYTEILLNVRDGSPWDVHVNVAYNYGLIKINKKVGTRESSEKKYNINKSVSQVSQQQKKVKET